MVCGHMWKTLSSQTAYRTDVEPTKWTSQEGRQRLSSAVTRSVARSLNRSRRIALWKLAPVTDVL